MYFGFIFYIFLVKEKVEDLEVMRIMGAGESGTSTKRHRFTLAETPPHILIMIRTICIVGNLNIHW